ncbi:MAG TPA: dipeptide ABC transporter ATP-binding protein [Solirubrobacterales bacterium]|nr:dipeptide ABC transporter ATP-binding protein [Solirubrobacterales bacterium]
MSAGANDGGRRRDSLLLRFARTRRGRAGLVLLGLTFLLAFLGPALAPHSPTALIGPPGSPPGTGTLLGTDFLGRDVLSRVLYGGRSVLGLSLAATAIALAFAIPIGMVAGYSRSLIDPVLMRSVDVILAFPPLLFFLLVATSFGTSRLTLIVAVALVQMPGISRIVYGAVREASVRGYVEAAVARGERTPAILRREILPNILGPLISSAGLYLTFSILLIAAVNFLNLGLQPPASNWALMISENRQILTLNPWATIVPAACICLLTVSVNLVGDAVSAELDRTSTEPEVRAPAPPATEPPPPEPPPGAGGASLLAVRDLRVRLRGGPAVIDEVSLELPRGRALGVVGESGSGKSTLALALLGYVRPGVEIAAGAVELEGEPMPLDDERRARALRGRVIAHVPQDPASSLNPSLRIGDSVADVIVEHRPDLDPVATTVELLSRVRLPSEEAFRRRFPHQLSGGQQQRVLIAMALACTPALIVLDEPTTGLDVLTQAHVLAEIEALHRDAGLALIYVSHDLAVVSQIADEIAVMYAGRIVERGPTATVLSDPQHPYTRGLVESVPDHLAPHALNGIPGVSVGVGERPRGCSFAPRCPLADARCEAEMPLLAAARDAVEVRCFRAGEARLHERVLRPPRVESARPALLSVDELCASHRGRESRPVVEGVSFVIHQGECLALAGESGSGKTTIARVIAGLHRPSAGSLTLGGERLAATAGERPREQRRRIQIVFQNPDESLNPRRLVAEQVARPARLLAGQSAAAAEQRAAALLERVRLPERVGTRLPSELSGGERQRVAVARALAADPQLLVCDEITSALDVSVQAAVVELLAELRAELDLSLLFITHNLGVVASLADRVLILSEGRVCEGGPVGEVFAAPRDRRTRELLAAAPRLAGAADSLPAG